MHRLRLILLFLLFAVLAACGVISPEVTSFYTPPDPLPAGAPGEIIKTEKIETNHADVLAWRVMYHSRDLEGNDTAVTGLFAVPAAPPPTGGYPLLAVAHGTEGLAQKCAPSLDPWGLPPLAGDFLSFPDSALVPFVKAGYAITAADYQGLGAPGESSFMVGPLEAQNVLDSIRAARSFDAIALDDQNFLWGMSQGGHAATFAAQLAPELAPELTLNGIILAAPAMDLERLVKAVLDHDRPSPVTGVAAMVAASWNQTYDLPLDVVLTQQGIDGMPIVRQECILGAVAAFAALAPSTYYFADPTTTSPWSDTMILNTPKALLYPAPVFVAQGGKDPVVAAQTTQAFVGRLCEAGNVVQLSLYPNGDHWTVVKDSNADVLAWLDNLRRGQSAPSNCPAPAANSSTPPPTVVAVVTSTATPTITPSATPTRTATPPAGVTPISARPFDGVILAHGDFTPEAAAIAELEWLLPEFLAQNQHLFNPTRDPIVERLPGYKRQYWGETRNGKQYVVVNAMCRPLEGWQTRRVLILDGGDCFFSVEYDLEDKTFLNLSVNGEA